MDNRAIYLLEPGDLITNDGKVLEFIKVLQYRRSRPERLEFKNVVTKEIVTIFKWNLTTNWRTFDSSHPQWKAIKVLYGTVKG